MKGLYKMNWQAACGMWAVCWRLLFKPRLVWEDEIDLKDMGFCAGLVWLRVVTRSRMLCPGY